MGTELVVQFRNAFRTIPAPVGIPRNPQTQL